MKKIALATLPNGLVNTHLGKANRISVATVDNKQIVDWEEIDVPFAKNHEQHHAGHEHGQGSKHLEGIRDFMVEQGINTVLAEHSGPGIKKALEDSNIDLVVVDINGSAKEVVQRYID